MSLLFFKGGSMWYIYFFLLTLLHTTCYAMEAPAQSIEKKTDPLLQERLRTALKNYSTLTWDPIEAIHLITQDAQQSTEALTKLYEEAGKQLPLLAQEIKHKKTEPSSRASVCKGIYMWGLWGLALSAFTIGIRTLQQTWQEASINSTPFFTGAVMTATGCALFFNTFFFNVLAYDADKNAEAKEKVQQAEYHYRLTVAQQERYKRMQETHHITWLGSLWRNPLIIEPHTPLFKACHTNRTGIQDSQERVSISMAQLYDQPDQDSHRRVYTHFFNFDASDPVIVSRGAK